MNKASVYGNDLYVVGSQCMTDYSDGKNTLPTSTCSSSAPKNNRVSCGGGFTNSILQNDCSDEVV
jgi:hypothetical protein